MAGLLQGGANTFGGYLFQFHNREFSFASNINEDGYRLSKRANFNETEIIGRSSPIITYASSSAMTLDVTVQLWALSSAQDEVTRVVSSLLSLTFPERPGIQPPSLCYVTLGGGSILNNWECVCAKVDPHLGPHPIWSPEGDPISAFVGLSFIGVELENVAAREWLQIRDYTTSAFRRTNQ